MYYLVFKDKNLNYLIFVDAIYELSNQNSQIVATTHSPYLIDLSRKPRQLLNRLKHVGNEVQNNPFSVTDAFIA